jgi:hypothetical protein
VIRCFVYYLELVVGYSCEAGDDGKIIELKPEAGTRAEKYQIQMHSLPARRSAARRREKMLVEALP